MGSVGERLSQEKQVPPCGARRWSQFRQGREGFSESAVQCRQGGQGGFQEEEATQWRPLEK